MKTGTTQVAALVAALAITATVHAQSRERDAALAAMVAAERAFAAATAEVGVRNGFLTFFADDSVALESVADGTARVVSARTRIAAGPVVALPPPTALTWVPFIGQVSADGGLGWLSGPSENRTVASGTVAHGVYFSVWRRRADGVWQVWLDLGSSAPTAWTAPRDFRAADEPGPAAADPLSDVESQVSASQTAWTSRLAPGVRLHRSGVSAALGREAAIRWATTTGRTTYAPARTLVSDAGDLGVAMGGYAATTASGAERGIYARVWQRAADAHWCIVFEMSRAQ